MTMWIIIMWTIIAFVSAALFYLGFKVIKLIETDRIAQWGKFKRFSLGLLIILGITGIIVFCLDFVNAIVCVMYLAMIWLVCDLIFGLVEKALRRKFQHCYAGWLAIIITVAVLGAGWYLNHTVWITKYQLTTAKDIDNLRIVMLADAHIGTTFSGTEFAKHIAAIQAQNPDIVVVVGDFVDDGTDRENMRAAVRNLGRLKTKFRTYFVFGNHDKGYYGSARRGFSVADLIDELDANGITLLRDESVLVANSFYVIGRRDYSVEREQGGKRKSIEELTTDLDESKYMIVLDHQPVEYEKEADAEVDLVLSGHTHGGQLFPFNKIGKLIKANDLIYGYEKRQNTDFIVTSGISDWAIKFKTGTKSEFVVIDVKGK